MCFGVGFYSVTISDIGNLIKGIDVETSICENILNDLEDIIRHCDIPNQIQVQVIGYFELNSRKNELWAIDMDYYKDSLP
jgi:hypothetical protein